MTDGIPEGLPVTFSAEQAPGFGVPEHELRSMLRRGLVERIGRGLYRRMDAEPADTDLIEIAFPPVSGERRAT
jgi:predicted transcriptional regulator of viral defense system